MAVGVKAALLVDSTRQGVWNRYGQDGYVVYEVLDCTPGGKGYVLRSNYAWEIFANKHMGNYPSLEEAFRIGEQFLRGITLENYLKRTKLAEGYIASRIAKLPSDVLAERAGHR